MSAQGIVYLVGAGPGDPNLLTLRAFELIRSAQVVAHDELVSPEILALISSGAELLAVGRRHGRGKIDYRLHPLVLERARAGRVVVRLKSGDPLIFGRGAEEAEELADAGIPFEIVPGVSAALGAAAYAGIPLTHRCHAPRVTFATGHRAEPAGPAHETVVLYMAAHRLKENLDRLIADGYDPSTPAAYIAAATTPKQLVISGTLANLADKVEPKRRSDPALVIVGSVVSLRDRILWLEKMPLRGRRVLVALAGPGPSKIAAQLRALGAYVLERPGVAVGGNADGAAPDSAWEQGIPACKYWCRTEAPDGELPELIVLPNSSAARRLLSGENGKLLSAVPMLAFGPTTEAAARLHGAQKVLSLRANSIESAVSNTIQALRKLVAPNLELTRAANGKLKNRVSW